MIKWFKDLFDYRAKYKASIQQRLFNEDADREAARQALIILQKYEVLTASLPPEHELSTQMYWKDYADKRLMRENANLMSTLNKLRADHASMTNLWIENISKYGVQMYGKWQPIEIAPKDGTPILALLGPFMYIVFWSDHPDLKHDHPWWEQGHAEWENGKWIGYHEHFYAASPTHWMPLPEPLK